MVRLLASSARRRGDRSVMNNDSYPDDDMPPPPTPPKKKQRLSDATDVTWTSTSTTTSPTTTTHDESSQVRETAGPYDNETPPEEGTAVPFEETPHEEEEVDWDNLATQEPAKTDVPIFLDAKARKEAADDSFCATLDETHSKLHSLVDDILQCAADMYSEKRDAMELMEADIVRNLQHNDELRGKMQRRLEETATAAQGLFAQLLMRVTQPLQAMVDSPQEATGAAAATAASE